MLEWLVSENMYIYAKTTLPFYVNIPVIKITELTERHTQLCEWVKVSSCTRVCFVIKL